MSAETTLEDKPLELVAHALCDISLKLDELWHDLQDIKGQLSYGQDMENRLEALEALVHAAMMGELDEGDTDGPSLF